MTKTMDHTIYAYTDGACNVTTGDGGWGFVLKRTTEDGQQRTKELKGGEKRTTNNRMELMAAINALRFLTKNHSNKPIVVTTDSQYVRNGITSWIKSWKAKNWMRSKKEPVKNVDLWKALDELNENLNVKWEWVKAHNGHIENERADELARQGKEAMRKA